MRFAFGIAVAALASFAAVTLVAAGGWAVVTLDKLPAGVVAGEPVTISFVVRQHGVEPLSGLQPKIVSRNVETNESVTAKADPGEAKGHYTASVTFPSPGPWDWHIESYSFPQPMPRLYVQGTRTESAAVAASNPIDAFLRWLSSLFGNNEARFPQAAPSAIASTGHDLFVAKGCVVCHEHVRAKEARSMLPADFAIGPDLSTPRWNKEFLSSWLKDPSAVRPGTQMPTLGLAGEEIEALTEFLLQTN